MKTKKLYKVGIGLLDDNTDVTNWRSKNVVAEDVPGAMRKARLCPNEYVEEVINLKPVDVA